MITRVPTFTVEKDLYVDGKIYLGSVDVLALFAATYAPSDAEYVTTLADPAIPNAVVLTGTAGQIVVTPGVGTAVLSLDAAGAGAGITNYVRDVTLDAQGRVTALTSYGAAPQVALSAGVGTVPLLASNTIRSLSNTSTITFNDAGGTTAVTASLANTAVTAGVYSHPRRATVDAQGRLTSMTSGKNDSDIVSVISDNGSATIADATTRSIRPWGLYDLYGSTYTPDYVNGTVVTVGYGWHRFTMHLHCSIAHVPTAASYLVVGIYHGVAADTIDTNNYNCQLFPWIAAYGTGTQNFIFNYEFFYNTGQTLRPVVRNMTGGALTIVEMRFTMMLVREYNNGTGEY